MAVRVVLVPPTQFIGLDADAKPTEGVAPGSQYIGADQGTVYLYSGDAWYLQVGVGAAAVLAQVEANEMVKNMNLELTAIRIGIQERLNEGNSQQHDLREMAQTVLDRSETEEP